MISILIGGDLYPGGKIQKAFVWGDAEEIFHDLLDDILYADISICNLESPLISRQTPIEKGYQENFGVTRKAINGIVSAGWDVINLANNHILDHGLSGLEETIDAINKVGLYHLGAGKNLTEASQPLTLKVNGQKIILYAMAEHEFSIASKDQPGANPLDLINFVRTIQFHKNEDIFIALVHGGKEYYPYPSPEMIRTCRFMIDLGADAVICCHTHCPLPWEEYKGKPIIYGLGNLIFESFNWSVSDDWYKGYLVKLIIENKNINFQIIPYLQSKDSLGAHKMGKNDTEAFICNQREKGKQLKDEAFIEKYWISFCNKHKNEYLQTLFGYNKIMRKFGSVLLPILHTKKDVLRSLALINCEIHHEMLRTIFNIELGRTRE